MSVQESSATALIRFTGLGIICLNDAKQRGEVGVIRDNKHQLSISIQQPTFQDSAGTDIIVYRDIATYENLPNEDVELEIKATDTPAVSGFEIYQPGQFDRLDSPDSNDFRWLVNMNELHSTSDLAPTGQQHHPLTKLYIGNGLFYTHKLDTNLFFEKAETAANGQPSQSTVFGNIAETLGVKIEAGAVSFKIRIGGQEDTHVIKRIEGLPFRIVIKNMDYGANAIYSDMPEYYQYLSPRDGVQVELKPVVEEAAGESVNQLEFCHPIVTNLSSIDDL